MTTVNDAPAGADKAVATLEGTAYTFTVADFGFSDSGGNALLAVRITTLPAAGSLTLSGLPVTAGEFISVANITAGNLVFAPGADANGAAYAAFTFQVQDDGGTANGGVDLDPSPNILTINVTGVNDAPEGADQVVTIPEDTAYTFTVADFGFSDPLDGNALQAVRIATLPAAGSLTLSGVTVTAGQFVSTASIAAGNLRFTPGANANGAAYAGFTFQVQDDGGYANGGVDLDPSPNTLTINVIAVNDAPAGNHKTVTTLEDTAYTFSVADFGFSDPLDGNALQSVRITTLPAAGSLTLSGVAVTTGQSVSAVNITAGNLRFTPAPDASGTGYASLTFQVRDNGGTANGGVNLDPTPNTLTVNVTAVSDNYLWSSFVDGQVIPFDPATDLLRFDDAAISAADIDVDSGSIILDDGLKTVTLEMNLAAAAANITFQNGSRLVVGDNTIDTASDDAANTLTGGSRHDHLIGLGGNDTLIGGNGNDRLRGGTGNDSLNGGAGADNMAGGMGDDTYVASTGTDVITETAGEGVDLVRSMSNFTLGAEVENLTLLGTANINGTGNKFANAIDGNSGNNQLSGGNGNDTLDGGTGSDTLMGGGGLDVLVWDAADRSVQGGTGTDILRLDGAGKVIDLALVSDNRITDVEVVDITGSGDNSLTLALADVLAISSSTDTLRIDGNAGDALIVTGGGWVDGGVAAGYHRYTQATATLLVDADISTTM